MSSTTTDILSILTGLQPPMGVAPSPTARVPFGVSISVPDSADTAISTVRAAQVIQGIEDFRANLPSGAVLSLDKITVQKGSVDRYEFYTVRGFVDLSFPVKANEVELSIAGENLAQLLKDCIKDSLGL